MSDDYRIDSHKLMFHPQRVWQWLEAGSDWEKAKKTYPLYIEISPAGACNHRCVFCAMDYIGYQRRELSTDVMEGVLYEMGRLGVKSVMFAGEGEPFLNKNIERLSITAKEAGLDMAFTTNGVLLTEEVARAILPMTSWIKISLNAGTPETYAAIHRTKPSDFHRVIRNLKRAVEIRNEAGSPCTLGAQILLLPENKTEIELLARICRDDVGLDYLVIKPYSQHRLSETRTYERINYESMVTAARHAERLTTDRFKVIYRVRTTENQLKAQRNFSACAAVPFFWAHVMANHDVYACSAFLQDDRFLLGNLKEATFQEIWEGDRRRRLFEVMMNGFDLTQCRLNCRMGFVNEYLHQLRNPHSHVNFI